MQPVRGGRSNNPPALHLEHHRRSLVIAKLEVGAEKCDADLLFSSSRGETQLKNVLIFEGVRRDLHRGKFATRLARHHRRRKTLAVHPFSGHLEVFNRRLLAVANTQLVREKANLIPRFTLVCRSRRTTHMEAFEERATPIAVRDPAALLVLAVRAGRKRLPMAAGRPFPILLHQPLKRKFLPRRVHL